MRHRAVLNVCQARSHRPKQLKHAYSALRAHLHKYRLRIPSLVRGVDRTNLALFFLVQFIPYQRDFNSLVAFVLQKVHPGVYPLKRVPV